jgi:hypothetical protein
LYEIVLDECCVSLTQTALLGRLDANPHLQALANSPLMCAMRPGLTGLAEA